MVRPITDAEREFLEDSFERPLVGKWFAMRTKLGKSFFTTDPQPPLAQETVRFSAGPVLSSEHDSVFGNASELPEPPDVQTVEPDTEL